MKKLIILAVVGLVAGIGGGTGIAIVMKPAVVADSTAVDSTAAHPDTTAVVAAAPAAGHDNPPADSAHTADSTGAPRPGADSASASHAASDSTAHEKPAAAEHDKPAPAAAPVATVAKDSVQRAQVRRISRIFAAMAPREASKVLQQLADSDVTVILASLTEKQAAAILMAFPPERAATISRGSLRGVLGKNP